MVIHPETLQRAFRAVDDAGAANQRILHVGREPSWVRVLDAGRTSQLRATELGARADELAAAAPGDPNVVEVNDFLRGAAWHANDGVNHVRGAVSEALAGHEDLQTAARRLLDTSAPVDMYHESATFETSVKRVDPALLERIGEAGHAAAGSLGRAQSDLDSARWWLTSIAQSERPVQQF